MTKGMPSEGNEHEPAEAETEAPAGGGNVHLSAVGGRMRRPDETEGGRGVGHRVGHG